jgi:FtsZ-binding cell division protein ZapB
MAETTILHQEITLLKLRISSLESQRNKLETELSVAVSERNQSDNTAKKLMDEVDIPQGEREAWLEAF